MSSYFKGWERARHSLIHAPLTHDAPKPVPEGTIEHSPAFQRRGRASRSVRVPKVRLNFAARGQSSHSGRETPGMRSPALKTPGYLQKSLRDFGKNRACGELRRSLFAEQEKNPRKNRDQQGTKR